MTGEPKVRPWVADLILLSVAAVWGATFVVVKEAVESIPPFAFIAIRFLIAALFLLLIFPKRLAGIKSSAWLDGGLLGLAMFAGYAFQTIGLMYTTSSNAGFITGLSVVMVPLFALVFLRQIPSVHVVLAVAGATLGLAMMTLSPQLTVSRGDILVFFCAIGFGLHIFFAGLAAKKHDAVVLALIQISLVALLSGAAWWLFEPSLSQEHFPPAVLWALLLTALPATALAFLAQMYLQKFTTATRTALIFASEPVFALITAIIFAGESLLLRGYFGGALVLGAILLAEIKPFIKNDR